MDCPPMSHERPKRSRTRSGSAPHAPPPGALKRNPGKLARAKIRHFLFTVAPDRLTRGALKRRHLERPVELRELTLHVPSWPERWEGVRIAHLSDFHLGELMPVERAVSLVERVAKVKPDLLACTGDVVDLDWHGAEPLLAAMGGVPATLGRYLVLGNHDLLDDPASLSCAASRNGMRVLHDAVERVDDDARGEIRVGGIDWGRTKRELSKRVEALSERPDLLLAHNPKAFPSAARLGVPLTLAGHTHGGQFGLPDRRVQPGHGRGASAVRGGVGREATGATVREHRSAASDAHDRAPDRSAHHAAPAKSRTRLLRKGFYAQGQSRLFVNVGAGSWFPARVNCPAEVLILTVRR